METSIICQTIGTKPSLAHDEYLEVLFLHVLDKQELANHFTLLAITDRVWSKVNGRENHEITGQI